MDLTSNARPFTEQELSALMPFRRCDFHCCMTPPAHFRVAAFSSVLSLFLLLSDNYGDPISVP